LRPTSCFPPLTTHHSPETDHPPHYLTQIERDAHGY